MKAQSGESATETTGAQTDFTVWATDFTVWATEKTVAQTVDAHDVTKNRARERTLSDIAMQRYNISGRNANWPPQTIYLLRRPFCSVFFFFCL